jgi:signal-transduction protein with cAMP-binding, CBS, and nucleotidyltransferase domain
MVDVQGEGIVPHMLALLDTVNRVSAVMPAGQVLGMVDMRELVPRLREDRVVRVLHEEGNDPVRELESSLRLVRAVNREY